MFSGLHVITPVLVIS